MPNVKHISACFLLLLQKNEREPSRETILIEMSNEFIFSTFQTIPAYSLLLIERKKERERQRERDRERDRERVEKWGTGLF
jgi:hypothetical protein